MYYDQFWILQHKVDIMEEVQPKPTKTVKSKEAERKLFKLKRKSKGKAC